MKELVEIKKGSHIEYRIGNKNGKLHREDGPAMIFDDGSYKWYKNGKLHREDGPAIEWMSGNRAGSKEWFINGKEHREDGPQEIDGAGNMVFRQNGKLHREDGPVHEPTIPNSAIEYYQRGKLHREDGPAVINPSGSRNGIKMVNSIEKTVLQLNG